MNNFIQFRSYVHSFCLAKKETDFRLTYAISYGSGFGNPTKTKKEEERAVPTPAIGWDQTINPPARRSSDKHTATRGFSDTVIACVGTFNFFGLFANLQMK